MIQRSVTIEALPMTFDEFPVFNPELEHVRYVINTSKRTIIIPIPFPMQSIADIELFYNHQPFEDTELKLHRIVIYGQYTLLQCNKFLGNYDGIMDIFRKVKFDYQLNMQDYGNYSAAILNGEFNRIYSILRHYEWYIKRTLRLKKTDDELPGFTLPIKTERRNKLVGFSDSGDIELHQPEKIMPEKLKHDKGDAPGYSIRAWAVFDGRDPHNSRQAKEIPHKAAGNLTRITRESKARYSITLRSPLASSNVVVLCSGSSITSHKLVKKSPQEIEIECYRNSSLYEDENVQVMILG